MYLTKIPKDNHKYILPTLESVTDILSLSSGLVNIPAIGFKDGLGLINKDKCSIMLNIESKKSFHNELRKQMQIEINVQDKNYISKDALFRKEAPQLYKSNIKYTLELHNILWGYLTDNLFFRMVLPVENHFLHMFLLPIKSFIWEKASCFSLIKTSLNGCNYDIFEITFNNANYLIIECDSVLNINDFYNQSISILLVLGFFTSFFIQNECFILGSGDKDYQKTEYIEYRALRESISMPFRFLGNDLSAYTNEKNTTRFLTNMPKILQEPLDELVKLCHNNNEVLNCLFVFTASSCYPLDTRPACISVALEGICNFIYGINKERLNPIKDRIIAKDIKTKIMTLLKLYKDIIDEEAFIVLEKRINDLNSPTNLEKLLKPYELLGIKLKKYEIIAIKNRNNFLHSNLVYETGIEIKDSNSEAYQLFFICNVLSRLFYKLILKLINYKGTMINNIKADEYIHGEMLDEELLIEI